MAPYNPGILSSPPVSDASQGPTEVDVSIAFKFEINTEFI